MGAAAQQQSDNQRQQDARILLIPVHSADCWLGIAQLQDVRGHQSLQHAATCQRQRPIQLALLLASLCSRPECGIIPRRRRSLGPSLARAQNPRVPRPAALQTYLPPRPNRRQVSVSAGGSGRWIICCEPQTSAATLCPAHMSMWRCGLLSLEHSLRVLEGKLALLVSTSLMQCHDYFTLTS